MNSVQFMSRPIEPPTKLSGPLCTAFNVAAPYSMLSCTQQIISNLFIQRYMHSLSNQFCLFGFLKTRGPPIPVRLIEFWNTGMVRAHTACSCGRVCVV